MVLSTNKKRISIVDAHGLCVFSAKRAHTATIDSKQPSSATQVLISIALYHGHDDMSKPLRCTVLTLASGLLLCWWSFAAAGENGRVHGSVELDENNWTDVLSGEWMILLWVARYNTFCFTTMSSRFSYSLWVARPIFRKTAAFFLFVVVFRSLQWLW